MSRTLNLADHLLERARRFHDLGRHFDAQHLLTRLTGLKELSPQLAEEALVRLAEIMLRRRRYLKARRCLAAALLHNADNARYHYLMGQAADADGKGDAERATEHYRRSLELEPRQVCCLIACGLLAVRLGDRDEGLARLREAAELSPDEPENLRHLAVGLRRCGQAEEAEQVLRLARFRHPRDMRFAQLWNDFRFQQMRRAQQETRAAAALANDAGPVLLSYARRAEQQKPRPLGNGLRLDPAAQLPASHLSRPVRSPEQRHAQ
jgi:tetratricopeptide (TPR) repeat protein